MSPEELARLFHETYERLAPSFGYSTPPYSVLPWKYVAEVDKQLMIAVAGEVLKSVVFKPTLSRETVREMRVLLLWLGAGERAGDELH